MRRRSWSAPFFLLLLSGLILADPEAEPEADAREGPIAYPGTDPEHINCSGVHTLLDQG
jgi:hypothetical protein